MEDNLFNLNNKIYSNNNNILLEIINELNQIKSDSDENFTIQRLNVLRIMKNYIALSLYKIIIKIHNSFSFS